MKSTSRYWVTGLCSFIFVVSARAEHIIYDMTPTTARTLQGLGTRFVLGCVALSLGIVLAAIIMKKK